MKQLFALLIPVALLIGGSTPASAQLRIKGFLSCVDIDPVTSVMTAYFGYESFQQSVLTIALGIDNRFLPPPAGRDQPTIFLPGFHDKAFRVTGGTDLFWIFNGAGVEAKPSSPRCAPTTVQPAGLAVLALPPATVLTPYSQQLAAIGGPTGVVWSSVGALPVGFTLSQAGVFSGTPPAAGTVHITVKATDGHTADQRTYSLLIGNGVTINDAGSTRAPGFAPQFRTVTHASSTISATALCHADEFVVTGGGVCTVPNSNTVQGRIAASEATSNGWQVTCSGGTATAVAVCSLK